MGTINGTHSDRADNGEFSQAENQRNWRHQRDASPGNGEIREVPDIPATEGEVIAWLKRPETNLQSLSGQDLATMHGGKRLFRIIVEQTRIALLAGGQLEDYFNIISTDPVTPWVSMVDVSFFANSRSISSNIK